MAEAGLITQTGTFTADDQRAVISFQMTADASVTLRTWSFGGGTNGLGQSIARGGFAPVLSLFSASGDQDLLAFAQAGDGGCAGNADVVTGFCWDVFIDTFLTAGNYFAVLTVFDNSPIGLVYGDGYTRDGQGNFTGPAFKGSAGRFVAPGGSQRDGHWALDIQSAALAGPSTPIPVPALAHWLLGIVLMGQSYLRRQLRA